MADTASKTETQTSAPGLADAEAIWRIGAEPAGATASIGVFAPPEARGAFAGAGFSVGADAASADWVGAFAAGDGPAPHAFARLCAAIRDANADAIVTDHATANALVLKPAFDPLLLDRVDYVGGAVVFRAKALGAADGAALAGGAPPVGVLRRRTDLRVAHLPYPAFRIAAAASTRRASAKPAAASTTPAADTDAVAAVIPNRNSPALIREVVGGLLRRTRPAPAEIVIIDNGSDDRDTLAFYDELRSAEPRVIIDIHPAPFNFSAMVNRGAALTRSAAILLLNNDIEVLAPDWLALMAETLSAPDVGVVGAKLLFPDLTIQHAGVIVGHGGVAGHDMKGMPRGARDPVGRMTAPHQRSAVTAACALIRRPLWEALGGFDEDRFAVAFNDVDFCLRARAAGWRVALDPRAELIHHESVSRRGRFSISALLARRRERAALRRRHGTIGYADPFESPWRDPDDLRPNFRALSGAPAVRFAT